MKYFKNVGCLLIIVLIGFIACKSDPQITSHNLILGDTVAIRIHETLINEVNGISILMDSVLGDSRCPLGAECIWAGNGEVRFIFKTDSQQVKFSLNTLLNPKESTINGCKITLLDLLPYPIVSHPINFNQYYAKILIQKN